MNAVGVVGSCSLIQPSRTCGDRKQCLDRIWYDFMILCKKFRFNNFSFNFSTISSSVFVITYYRLSSNIMVALVANSRSMHFYHWLLFTQLASIKLIIKLSQLQCPQSFVQLQKFYGERKVFLLHWRQVYLEHHDHCLYFPFSVMGLKSRFPGVRAIVRAQILLKKQGGHSFIISLTGSGPGRCVLDPFKRSDVFCLTSVCFIRKCGKPAISQHAYVRYLLSLDIICLINVKRGVFN